MIAQALALYALAALFGGMLLYSFGFAPLLFAKLPAAQASALLREAFPLYYLFVVATAGVATLALFGVDAPSAWLLGIVVVLGIAARQLLMPAINRASDARGAGEARAGTRFARLHGLSVAINFLQLAAVAFALSRIA